MYPDPETFNPDRFLKDGKINPDVRDPNTFVFGYGRRYVSCFSSDLSIIVLTDAGSVRGSTSRRRRCSS